MEQTTNVFNKGLQTDTHPMVQGNDTLSDALNATLVTMNGNEVVLQNDMGNAKIDNAYLPPGYLPVGMKEYGGIIYVAAYNPITNKSLIGSFPSPERKISVEDKDLGNKINLDTDFSFNKLEGINFLNNDILLIPLTSDTSLHAGDKFTVYSSYIWDNKDNITNFDNNINDVISNLRKLYEVEEDIWKKNLIRSRIYILQSYLLDNSNKVYSPKNKKYTLSLGILNSLNEFVDITKSLIRWNNEKPIEFTNESDLVKFNTGYFIAEGFTDPLKLYAGNDKKLIAERLKMAINSYAYKLIGPLYLKAELNHIKNFDFSIEGTKIPGSNPDSTDAEVLIRATITYNCPDGINTISGSGDNNYFDYFLGKLEESNFPGFHLYKKSGDTYERLFTDSEEDKYYNTPETKYNPETNLYEVTIEKKYIISPTSSDNKYEYYVCVPSGYKNKDGDDVYIKGLSTKGEIDFDKLGSGTLEINEWRFYNTMPTENNSGKTILTYGFNSYPRIGHTFSDMKIFFIDDTKEIYSFDTDILNRENIEINWNNGFEKNKLYRAIISYKDNGEEKTIKNEWLLTTTLFNDCYFLNSNDFIKDYVIFNSNYELPEGDPRLEIKNKLLNLDIDVNDGIKVITKSDYNSYAPKLFGDINETLPDNFNVENNYTYNISCINPTLTIKNIDLYPDYVNLDDYNNIVGIIKWNDFTSNVTIPENSSIKTITFTSIRYDNNDLKINFIIEFKNTTEYPLPNSPLHWEFFENDSSKKSNVIENPSLNQNIGVEYKIKEDCIYKLECWIESEPTIKNTIKISTNIALNNKLNVVNYGDPSEGVTKDVYVTTKQIQSSFIPFNRAYSVPFYKLLFQIDQKFLGTYTEKLIIIDHLFLSFLSVFNEANFPLSNSNSPFNIKAPWFTLLCYNEDNCGGKSPKIVLVMVKNENNFKDPVDAQENQIGENLILRNCHDGDEINIYNYSLYQDQISETLDSIHSDSLFVIGISKKIDNYGSKPYRAGNRLNSYDQNKPLEENNSSYVVTAWTKTINGWSVIILLNYSSIPDSSVPDSNKLFNDVLELLKQAVFTSNGWKNFHTDFKIDLQKKLFNVLNTYSYIDSYDFKTSLNYNIDVYIDGNTSSLEDRYKKFNKGNDYPDYPEFSLKLYNNINDNTELEFKSNSNFDNAIIEGIEISLSDEIDCYDEDLKIQYDINGNKLKSGVKYKKVNLGLTKNFNEANNIQEYSIVENVRTFSLPYVNSTLNTWYFWSLGNDDDDKEGLSVIGLKMDSQLKYFS